MRISEKNQVGQNVASASNWKQLSMEDIVKADVKAVQVSSVWNLQLKPKLFLCCVAVECKTFRTGMMKLKCSAAPTSNHTGKRMMMTMSR